MSTKPNSNQVKYDGGTVQDVLDSAKPMANYTALRAYTGRATAVRITTPGIAGFFQRDGDVVTADNGGTVIVDASGRRWKRVFDGAVNVRWFGAKGDGVADEYAAIATALAIGQPLFFPPGRYKSSAKLSPMPGQVIFGSNGGRFSTDATRTVLESTANGTPFFAYETLGPIQANGFVLKELTIISDNPVLINDPTILIQDSEGANPYVMRPEFYRCTFQAKTPGVGVGVLMSKCFGHVLFQNEFVDFARSLVMQGCDIGSVKTNRFTGASEYHILELSVGTFGSQNVIADNDILTMRSGGVFIKSTSRHVRIFNNYFEQVTAGVKGFIDLSLIDVPTYGSNAASPTRYLSVDVSNGNRLDGTNNATEFIYRIDAERSHSIKLHDTGTSGALPSVPSLSLLGDGGLPIMYNDINGVTYDIQGNRFGDLRGFVTNCQFQEHGKLVINAKNVASFEGRLAANNARQHMRILHGSIALLPTFASSVASCNLRFPPRNGVKNPYFVADRYYDVKVVARSTVAGDILKIAKLAALGSSFINFTLGVQNRTFTFIMSGESSSTEMGVYFSVGGGQVGTVLIDSIQMQEIKFGQVSYDPPSLSTGTQTAEVLVPVLGATVGNTAAAAFTLPLQGVSLNAYVSAPDTVAVIFRNDTGAPVNLASGSLRVWITSNA